MEKFSCTLLRGSARNKVSRLDTTGFVAHPCLSRSGNLYYTGKVHEAALLVSRGCILAEEVRAMKAQAGKGLGPEEIQELFQALPRGAWLVGHNLIAFDYPALQAGSETS